MADSHLAGLDLTDHAVMRRVAVVVTAVVFLLMAVVTLAAAPGSVVGRLALVGEEGVCLAAFAVLGLVVAARWKREDTARNS